MPNPRRSLFTTRQTGPDTRDKWGNCTWTPPAKETAIQYSPATPAPTAPKAAPAPLIARLADGTILTQDGTYTVTNDATGKHATYTVKTQKPDARFMPGSRIFSVLNGPDNWNNYIGVAFLTVKADGTEALVMWKRHQGTKWQAHAKAFEAIVLNGRFVNPNNGDRYSVLMAGKCCMCGRKLTTPQSVRSGIGPVCAMKD